MMVMSGLHLLHEAAQNGSSACGCAPALHPDPCCWPHWPPAAAFTTMLLLSPQDGSSSTVPGLFWIWHWQEQGQHGRGSQRITHEISAPCFFIFPDLIIQSHFHIHLKKKKKVDVCMNKWFVRAFGLILLHDFTGFWNRRLIPVSKRKECV